MEPFSLKLWSFCQKDALELFEKLWSFYLRIKSFWDRSSKASKTEVPKSIQQIWRCCPKTFERTFGASASDALRLLSQKLSRFVSKKMSSFCLREAFELLFQQFCSLSQKHWNFRLGSFGCSVSEASELLSQKLWNFCLKSFRTSVSEASKLHSQQHWSSRLRTS